MRSLEKGKPETFDFLGFTHFCTRSRKWGSFVIGRKTIKKRMRATAAGHQDRVAQDKCTTPSREPARWMKQMLQGHLNYFAVSGNHPSLWWFFNKVRWLWLADAKAAQPEGTPPAGTKFIRLDRPLLSANARRYTLCRCHRFDAKTRGRSPVR